MTRQRFKDRNLQRIYEACRALGADKASEFYYDGHPRRGAGHRMAYWDGRSGVRNRWLRTSMSYAAWRAGVDDMKDIGPVEGSEYRQWGRSERTGTP